MKKPVLLLLCIGLILLSCIDDKKARSNKHLSTKTSAGGQQTKKIDEFMRRGPTFPVGSSLAEIQRNLGQPVKKSVTERQNIHNKTLVDEIHKLYYNGLYIEVYHVTEMKKDILLILEVTVDKFPIILGLNVGSSKQKVRETLGKPNEEKAGLWRYYASDFVMGSFEFGFQNDTVVSIRWHYTID